ncbi:hypothetical protein ABMA32_18470 [Mesorhizobium sp. VNQ89]|uniref:hypothetical protein n=1 Tax=Mesorhizobium quangtriensis TaxID=3157709 RepID=UPI0032B87399
MDGRAAISDNVQALKRILVGLFAMAGLGSSPLAGEDGSAPRGKAEPPAEPGEGSGRCTLPRHLRLAILRILRPAESAARRLVIAAARGLVVALPPLRNSAPKPVDPVPMLRRFGIAVVLPPSEIARMPANAPHPEAQAKGLPRRTLLPLFDPPRRLRRPNGRTVPAHAAPRILSPGLAEPYRLPPPPSRDDPVDCTRLGLRLAALAAALDGLPAQARRFARWQARRSRVAAGRLPLRPGRPPGGRLSRFNPTAFRRRNIRDIDEVLAHAHALALHALQYPDTS